MFSFSLNVAIYFTNIFLRETVLMTLLMLSQSVQPNCDAMTVSVKYGIFKDFFNMEKECFDPK